MTIKRQFKNVFWQTCRVDATTCKFSQNIQTNNLNLGVKCGKEFDEGVELLSGIIVFNEVWVGNIRENTTLTLFVWEVDLKSHCMWYVWVFRSSSSTYEGISRSWNSQPAWWPHPCCGNPSAHDRCRWSPRGLQSPGKRYLCQSWYLSDIIPQAVWGSLLLWAQ